MNLTRLWVDFNEVYDDDFVWTSIRRTPGVSADMLGVDQMVELFDADGATCWARIVETKGHTVVCKLDWEQWRSVAVTPVKLRQPHGLLSDPLASGGVLIPNG
jgi:hypothetical protein